MMQVITDKTLKHHMLELVCPLFGNEKSVL